MRIRTRKNLKKKNTAIVGLFLLPIIGFGAFAGVLLYILYDIASFTYNIPPPTTDYFYPESEIDDDILAQMAEVYEYRLEKYHMPTNITVDVNFKDRTYEEVDLWHGTDNGALHVGKTLSAECLRYKKALDENNDEELENATRMVKKCVTAFSNMIAAPNGGLGINPETGKWYPGTLSRFVCAPQYKKYHPWMFDPPHPRHFNGTGDYSNWRVRLYTSRDEVAGYFFGLASVLKFITGDDGDSKWCVERVKLLVEQITEGFLSTNWLILNGDGNPTGSDLNPTIGPSTWQLTMLRLAATARPEKYLSRYQYCAAKMLTAGGANMGDVLNSFQDYYALSFGAHVMFALIILEDDPQLQYHYIKNFEEGFMKVVRYHRNAFFNVMHLAFMSLLEKNQRARFENPDYDDDDILWDVKDQLWRFYTSNWCPVRDYNLTDRPHSTRSTSLNPEIRAREFVPTKNKWRNFFENNMFGPLFSWIGEEFDMDEEIYMLPITVSEQSAEYFFWGDNPFYDEGGNLGGNGIHEAAGIAFTSVYWMGRAFGIF